MVLIVCYCVLFMSESIPPCLNRAKRSESQGSLVESPIRILLISPNETEVELFSQALAKSQIGTYQFHGCSMPQVGLTLLEQESCDLCFLNYEQKGLVTGLDIIAKVTANGVSVPMILLEESENSYIDQKALEVGAADYLSKDQLTPSLLERSIRYALRRAIGLKELKSLFDATFEGIIIHDFDGRIVEANQRAGQILGVSPGSMVGSCLCSYFDERSQKVAMEHIQDHQQDPNRFIHATGIRIQDAQPFEVEIFTKNYSRFGNKMRLTSIRDTSERKEMEAQILHQDRLASAGLLASSLAHEIGTPLGVIRGRAEILGMNSRNDGRTKRNLNIIMAQIDRVSKLIRSLLNLTRTENPMGAGPISVVSVIYDVLDLVAHDLKKLEVEVEISIDEQTLVLAEEDPLHQVILNLLVNSIHAIEEAMRGGRKTNHALHIFSTRERDHWVISITDTGCGITKENISHLFKPFFTTKEVGKGTGLGLATAYRIVHSWGGKITVESQEGVGSTFHITMRAIDSIKREGPSPDLATNLDGNPR